MESEYRILVEIEKLLSVANSYADIGHLFAVSIKRLGFDKYFYAVWDSNQPFVKFDVELGDCPEPLNLYNGPCFCNTEPVIKYCIDNTVPLIWDGKRIHHIRSRSIEEPLRKYREVYPLQDIPAGVLVPLHKVHDEVGFVYAWSERRCDSRLLDKMIENQPVILALSIYFHNAITRMKDSINCKDVKLTKREIQCLQSCQSGKTYKQISTLLGISERTVVFHITNLYRKLGVNNKTQAIKKAQALGLMKSYPTSVL